MSEERYANVQAFLEDLAPALRASGVGSRSRSASAAVEEVQEISVTEAVESAGGTLELARQLAPFNPGVKIKSIQRGLQRQEAAERAGESKPGKYRIFVKRIVQRSSPNAPSIGADIFVQGQMIISGDDRYRDRIPTIHVSAAKMRHVLSLLDSAPEKAAEDLWLAMMVSYGVGKGREANLEPCVDHGHPGIDVLEIDPEADK